MSLCPECGSPWSGTLSCPECAKRQQANVDWVCGNCGKKNRGDRKHCWSCSLPKTSASQTDRATENVGVRVGTALFGSSESAFHIDTATYEDSNTSVRTYELQNPIVDRYLDLYRVARFVDGGEQR